MRANLLLSLVLSFAPLAASANDAEVRKVAEEYLDAISGKGDGRGKEQLLGGVVMEADMLQIGEWKILGKDPVRREKGDLVKARKLVSDLDRAADKAMKKLGAEPDSPGDDLQMAEISADVVDKLMKPTRDNAEKLKKAHPVLAYTLRVGKPVYWHPRNPMRLLIARLQGAAGYELEVHRFRVEHKQGLRGQEKPVTWGLKIIRLRTGSEDTGYKVLAASDWSPE
jgi:hypothetical protein